MISLGGPRRYRSRFANSLDPNVSSCEPPSDNGLECWTRYLGLTPRQRNYNERSTLFVQQGGTVVGQGVRSRGDDGHHRFIKVRAILVC